LFAFLKVDNGVLSSILSGPSSKTLIRVTIPDETVVVNGLDSLEILKSITISNSKEREEKWGRKIFPEDPDFLADI